MAAAVLVLGSSNTDLVCTVDHLPAAGETVPSTEYAVFGGGKAANQAVASARAGAPTSLVGAVGNDDFGRQRMADLESYGVDTSSVLTAYGVDSGLAFIFVDRDGENQIVTYAGANDGLTAGHVKTALSNREAGILLATLESPPDCIVEAMRTAKRRGYRTLVNAAPFSSTVEGLLDHTDILIVNEIEAGQLVGSPVDLDSALSVGRDIKRCGPENVVITLGADGAVVVGGEMSSHLPALAVPVIDTTGAGDAFCGVLAASLLRGIDLLKSCERAIVAGSLAVTRPGAQPSMPSRDEIDTELGKQPA